MRIWGTLCYWSRVVQKKRAARPVCRALILPYLRLPLSRVQLRRVRGHCSTDRQLLSKTRTGACGAGSPLSSPGCSTKELDDEHPKRDSQSREETVKSRTLTCITAMTLFAAGSAGRAETDDKFPALQTRRHWHIRRSWEFF